MCKLLTSVLLLLLLCPGIAQVTDNTNQDASPKNGVNALALEFYRIDFTKGQRAQIDGKDLELIFTINETGKATLEEVNGLKNQDILDSLKNCAKTLSYFNPKVENGKTEESLYFLKLTYPIYERSSETSHVPSIEFRDLEYNDFEFIEEKENGFEYYCGLLSNQYIETPAEYLSTGVGLKFDFIWLIKNKIQLGANISFYANKLKQDYPIMTLDEQRKWQNSYFFGLLIGRKFKKISTQLELNYGSQTVTTENLEDFVEFNGWNTGLLVHYPININLESISINKSRNSITRLFLNTHIGVRTVQLSQKEVQGLMFEIGFGARLHIHEITNYKLK